MTDKKNERINRRAFLNKASLLTITAASAKLIPELSVNRLKAAPAVIRGENGLKITRVIAQNALGRRATPVAPNAFRGYRGYGCIEPLIRIQTNQGLEGLTRVQNPERRIETLQKLIGVNPFELVEWKDDCYNGPSDKYRELMNSLGGIDLAIFDILGKATKRPVADVLGKRHHDGIFLYDSSLYMEDLLTGEQRNGLLYLKGKKPPRNDAQMVAKKAEWLINEYYRNQGIHIYKIKTGRSQWMESSDAALKRDIEVFRSVRDAVGPYFTLFVDVNDGYDKDSRGQWHSGDHTAAKRFIEETSDTMLFGIEEMLDESKVDEHREIIDFAYSIGLRIRNIDGESRGIPPGILRETIETPFGTRPLFDINNPSFSHGLGFVQITKIAKECEKFGITIGPHNFASKIGFYASVHQGIATPNFEYAETDDTEFSMIRAPGFEIKNGKAFLTGVAGLGVELNADLLQKPDFIIE